MAEQFEMPRVKLESQGLEVSKLGYGCMGLSGVYNNPVPEEEGIAIIKEAFSKGITFFDTSDAYGLNHANEYLVGKVGTFLRYLLYIMATHLNLYTDKILLFL
ncbi:Hypothetical predicted protein [Olea europaea subsp. europaea]|uniref:NADP-dependent oxidoreductase domain-containing protein n=1 Tax=Olea europaea subsp. europaea TaxID=158383 RepID=A0A8S0SAZ5_OLEEU|nr:Hypothetical predicted protein [Olea europaea subsp. europaea]